MPIYTYVYNRYYGGVNDAGGMRIISALQSLQYVRLNSYLSLSFSQVPPYNVQIIKGAFLFRMYGGVSNAGGMRIIGALAKFTV